MKEKYLRNDFFEIWIENDLFFITHLCDCITLRSAQLMVEKRIEICEDKSYPMLSDIRSVIQTDREARQYLAMKGSAEKLLAGALLVRNVFQKTVGNIFIYTNKPPVPARLFTDETEAILWLEHFKMPHN